MELKRLKILLYSTENKQLKIMNKYSKEYINV